jgi:hypothetical protein
MHCTKSFLRNIKASTVVDVRNQSDEHKNSGEEYKSSGNVEIIDVKPKSGLKSLIALPSINMKNIELQVSNCEDFLTLKNVSIVSGTKKLVSFQGCYLHANNDTKYKLLHKLNGEVVKGKVFVELEFGNVSSDMKMCITYSHMKNDNNYFGVVDDVKCKTVKCDNEYFDFELTGYETKLIVVPKTSAVLQSVVIKLPNVSSRPVLFRNEANGYQMDVSFVQLMTATYTNAKLKLEFDNNVDVDIFVVKDNLLKYTDGHLNKVHNFDEYQNNKKMHKSFDTTLL